MFIQHYFQIFKVRLKWIINVHPLVVVGRDSETQLHVGENLINTNVGSQLRQIRVICFHVNFRIAFERHTFMEIVIGHTWWEFHLDKLSFTELALTRHPITAK